VLLTGQPGVLLALVVTAHSVLVVELEVRHDADACGREPFGLRPGQQLSLGTGIDNGQIAAHSHRTKVMNLCTTEPSERVVQHLLTHEDLLHRVIVWGSTASSGTPTKLLNHSVAA